jgi:hypothetical protein
MADQVADGSGNQTAAEAAVMVTGSADRVRAAAVVADDSGDQAMVVDDLGD